MADDSAKIAELSAIVEEVRQRVRARYPEPNGHSVSDKDELRNAAPRPAIRVPIADLMQVVHARDAAQAKVAAIGGVNPRAGGIANRAIQSLKKTVARALQWFVRDQIIFNRETVSAIEAIIEALNDHNRAVVSLASHLNEQVEALGWLKNEQVQSFGWLRNEQAEAMIAFNDIRSRWAELHAHWDHKVATNEIQFLRSVADLNAAWQQRNTLLESNYLGALDRVNMDIQKQVWRDMEKIRQEYDRLIHTELRLIRQRAPVAVPAPPAPTSLSTAGSSVEFDYGRFAERFRGPEEYVRSNVEFYRPFFANCENVLDIGCGRGEFLSLFQDRGIAAKGIDMSEECVAQCRQKGLDAEVADLFTYLEAQPEQQFDGIFSSQVVEHIEPRRLPEMMRLCAANLRRGGLLAIETPNPECLAIFATHFYLDPTHMRPIPHPLMAYYMEEAGLGQLEVHQLSPAVESFPELADLAGPFRKRFFGGLDYAIIGRKL